MGYIGRNFEESPPLTAIAMQERAAKGYNGRTFGELPPVTKIAM